MKSEASDPRRTVLIEVRSFELAHQTTVLAGAPIAWQDAYLALRGHPDGARGVADDQVRSLRNAGAVAQLLAQAPPDLSRATLYRVHGRLAHGLPAPQGAAPVAMGDVVESICDEAQSQDEPAAQAFHVLVSLAVLRPFPSANGRVARIAACIPLLRAQLWPPSFAGITVQAWRAAVQAAQTGDTAPLERLWRTTLTESASRYEEIYRSLAGGGELKTV